MGCVRTEGGGGDAWEDGTIPMVLMVCSASGNRGEEVGDGEVGE